MIFYCARASQRADELMSFPRNILAHPGIGHSGFWILEAHIIERVLRGREGRGGSNSLTSLVLFWGGELDLGVLDKGSGLLFPPKGRLNALHCTAFWRNGMK